MLALAHATDNGAIAGVAGSKVGGAFVIGVEGRALSDVAAKTVRQASISSNT